MKTYIRAEIPFKVIDDVCYIIDSFKTKSAYKLNESSTALWLYLEKAHTLEEIIRHFQEEFEGASEDEIKTDLGQLLQEMVFQTLVHES